MNMTRCDHNFGSFHSASPIKNFSITERKYAAETELDIISSLIMVDVH